MPRFDACQKPMPKVKVQAFFPCQIVGRGKTPDVTLACRDSDVTLGRNRNYTVTLSKPRVTRKE